MINEFTEGVFIVDCTGSIIDCNQLAANQLGYFRESILGTNIQKYLYNGVEEVLNIRERKKVVLSFRTPADEYLEVQAKVGYQPWPGDGAIYIIMESITHKAGYREKIAIIKPYEEVFHQYINLKNRYHPKLFREICSDIANILDIRLLIIYLYDQSQDSLVLQAGIGLSDEEFSRISVLSFRRSLAGRAYMEKKPQKIFLKDHPNPWIRQALENTGIDRIESYPIYFEDEILGAMILGDKGTIEERHIDSKVIEGEVERVGLFAKSMHLSQQLSKELAQRLAVEAEMALFFQSTRDFVFIMDENGQIKRVGDELKRVLGYDEQRIKEMNFFDFFQWIDEERVTEWLSDIREGKVCNDLLAERIGPDGTTYWISWIGQYLFERGIFFFSGRDVTELKENEERQRLLEQAVIRENVKNEFFTNVSHEFRTPINILLSSFQLLERKQQRGMTAEELQGVFDDYLPLMRKNSYRLLRLVNNLLDMTKIDSGYYKVSLENQDIISTIENIVMSAAEYIKSHDMKLIFDTDVEEKVIACDPDKIERIMLNLLSNGVKYSQDGGLIEVLIQDGEEHITIIVQDNGVGISETQQQVIFDRFMQVDGSLTRPQEGSGIGLALVKSLVEMHNGTIELESKLNQGSRFTIRLPIVQLEEGNAPEERRCKPRRDSRELCDIEFSDIEFSEIYK